MKIQNISTNFKTKNQMKKNNAMQGIAFKGYSKMCKASFYIGSSGVISSYDYQIKDKINNSSHTDIYECQRVDYSGHASCENTREFSVYFADPGEYVTPQINSEHDYVVFYKTEGVEDLDTESAKTPDALTKLINYIEEILDIREKADKNLEAGIKQQEAKLAQTQKTLDSLKEQRKANNQTTGLQDVLAKAKAQRARIEKSIADIDAQMAELARKRKDLTGQEN